MILSFKEKFPWGEPTHFKEKIWASVEKTNYPQETPKLHTIREGERWEPNMKLHMATGVRSKNYNQFNKDIPELQFVKSVQRIDILHRSPTCVIIFIDRKIFYSKIVYIKGGHIMQREFHPAEFREFIKNDGFDSEQDFWEWFSKPLRNGQLIHWSDLKY